MCNTRVLPCNNRVLRKKNIFTRIKLLKTIFKVKGYYIKAIILWVKLKIDTDQTVPTHKIFNSYFRVKRSLNFLRSKARPPSI